MRALSFSGTPRQIGHAFGETCRAEIAEFYGYRVRNALEQAKQHGGRDVSEGLLLAVAKACVEPTRAYHRAGMEELEGIAEGANMTAEQILAMNGLTDLRDVLSWNGELEQFGGCTSFIVTGDQTEDGNVICGQTWDLATDNMPFVLGVHRKPLEGPQTWTLTTVGCLSLIGINEAGVAVGTTNIRTLDARPGVTYLNIIHKVLAGTTLEHGIEAVRGAPRAGGHYYYVCDGEGGAAAIECSAAHAEVVQVREGGYVHANHCLVPAHREVEGNTPAASSHARHDRMETLIGDRAPHNTMVDLQQFLADRENGENAISRTDFNGISSNGAVVMSPQTGVISACHGVPHEARWLDLKAIF